MGSDLKAKGGLADDVGVVVVWSGNNNPTLPASIRDVVGDFECRMNGVVLTSIMLLLVSSSL